MAPGLRPLSKCFAAVLLLVAACGDPSGSDDQAAPATGPADGVATESPTSSGEPESALQQQARLAYKQQNQAFATNWRTRDGTITLPGGTAYRIIKDGNGATPGPQDMVTVRYKGWLIDGTIFDQTNDEETATFPVSGLIAGWTEVLQQMKEGMKIQVMIPADQAYGGQDRDPIKAFSTLVFDLELVKTQSRDSYQAARAAPGRAYLEANAQKDGVIVTKSGMQYRIIKAGDGPTVPEDATVRMAFTIRRIDGTVVEDTSQYPNPPMIPVERMIPGWREAVTLMSVGSVYDVALPPELAYGGRRVSDAVPPFSTLIFRLAVLGFSTAALEQDYLDKNRQKEGWITRDSGLQYRVIKAGKGDKPLRTSKVTVHYRGSLIDGREFDSSYARGEPAVFPVSSVIEGWIEGVRLMRPGAIYEFVIPATLGYGPQGTSDIPPHATLIFQIELLGVHQ